MTKRDHHGALPPEATTGFLPIALAIGLFVMGLFIFGFVPSFQCSGAVDPIPEPAGFEQAVTPALLRGPIAALTDDALRGRATPSAGLDRAAEVIASAFAALALEAPPGAPHHRQEVACGGDRPSANVIARLPGRDPSVRAETVVVSAHYDHLGAREDDGEDTDGVWNGANDNASGVAAMIGIASALARAPRPPRRSVLFVAFCGEELGLVGSRRYVAAPTVPLTDTIVNVNLEMLGRPTPGAPPTVWVTGMERSDLGAMLAAMQPHTGLAVVSARTIGAAEGEAFDRSDNYAFAEAGVVAHTLSTGQLDAYYHSPDDEIESLDLESMAAIVRGLALAVYALAEGDARPSWSASGPASGR